MLIGKDHRLKAEHLLQFVLGELRDPLAGVVKQMECRRWRARALFADINAGRLWAKQREIGTGLLAGTVGADDLSEASCVARILPRDLIAVIVTHYGAAGRNVCVCGRPPRIGNQCGVASRWVW